MRWATLFVVLMLSGMDLQTSVKNELVFVTRDGCVYAADMANTLDDALRALGWPRDYLSVNIAKLQKSDSRRGYPTPTVLWKGKDIFGMPVPTAPFPDPT